MEVKDSIFTLSLDFELFWGLKEKRNLPEMRQYLDNALVQIPKLLDLFDRYDIRVTCAVVGRLMDSVSKELLHYEKNDRRFLIADDLIRDFDSRGHEIASHTYDHIYHLDHDLSYREIRGDVQRFARTISTLNNGQIQSIIFPRNQYNESILRVYSSEGFKIYRGNTPNKRLAGKREEDLVLSHKVYRYFDSYFNLSGSNIAKSLDIHEGLVNIPASHFYRPYNKTLSSFEFLKKRRIMNSLKILSQEPGIYHLWFHPHNLGTHLNENLNFLEVILSKVNDYQKHGLVSNLTMSEIYEDFSSR